MSQHELNAQLVTALLSYMGQQMDINPDKTYKLNAKFKFDVKDGVLVGLDVKSIQLRER